MLSRWGRVAIDYDDDVLLLDPKIKNGTYGYSPPP